MTRRGKRLLAGSILLVAGLGHGAFWYLPRERAAKPDPEDLPGRLLRDPSFDAALWLPYPHQNLGAIPCPAEGGCGLTGLAAEAAGTALVRLPRFGPFAAPPAREAALAADLDGRRFLAAARVYPTMAALARLGGWLSGDPWLKGGEVALGGRQVTVRWQGTLWTAGTEDPEKIGTGDGVDTEEILGTRLAAFHLRDDLGPLPSGLYGLRRDGEALLVALEGALPRTAPGGDPQDLLGSSTALFAYSADGAKTTEEHAGAWLLFGEGPSRGLAEFSSPPERGVSGLTVGLGLLLGEDGFSGEHAGWWVQAAGRAPFQEAGRRAVEIEAFRQAWQAPGAPHLTFALAARPAPAAAFFDQVASRLQATQPASPAAGRLLAAAHLAAPLTGYERVTLLATRGPAGFALRLWAVAE